MEGRNRVVEGTRWGPQSCLKVTERKGGVNQELTWDMAVLCCAGQRAWI